MGPICRLLSSEVRSVLLVLDYLFTHLAAVSVGLSKDAAGPDQAVSGERHGQPGGFPAS